MIEKILLPPYADYEPNNPLRRPKISIVKPLLVVFIYALLFCFIFMIPFAAAWMKPLALVVYSIVYAMCIARGTIIWIVRVYQRLAPTDTRLKCAFEPSCSEYMILAVKKHGALRGGYKGIRRMFRCGDENGIDFP